jgi:protein SCO1/2
MTRPRASSLLTLFASLAVLAATGIASATDFRTSDVTGQGYGDVISGLVGPESRAYSGDDFKGHVTVLLFGFTQCPDICPTTLLNLSAVLEQLGEKSSLVQIAFVTVDPERDTAEVLQDYMSSFGPNFVGLTGEPDAVRLVAKAFKVFFQKVPLPGGDYTMDHSVAIYALDKHARVRLMFTMNRQLEDIAHDILELLREAS